MTAPNDRRYSRDHHWVRADGDLWQVGLTDFAQEALGEVTLVHVAAPGTTVAAGDEMGEVEAFKAMTDLYMPVDATVLEPNERLANEPTLVNDDPYGQGWLCRVRVDASLGESGLDDLFDADGYLSFLEVG